MRDGKLDELTEGLMEQFRTVRERMDTDTIAFADFGEYDPVNADVAPEITGDYMDFCDIFE